MFRSIWFEAAAGAPESGMIHTADFVICRVDLLIAR
jgi:hypothetical protein